jgi:hypothetical protein
LPSIATAATVTGGTERELSDGLRSAGGLAADARASAALSVEQFLVDPTTLPPRLLATEPFFLASLVRLAKVLAKGMPMKIVDAISILSVDAGAGLERVRLVRVGAGAAARRGVPRSLDVDRSLVFVAGREVLQTDWPHPTESGEALDKALSAFVRRTAAEQIDGPAFSVLRIPSGGGTKLPAFRIGPRLDPAASRDLVQHTRLFAPADDALYAGGELGWPLPPPDESSPLWVAVEPGRTAGRRGPLSGIAGVNQETLLPTWAAPRQSIPTDTLVWYAEKRVPPYLSPESPSTTEPTFAAPLIQPITPSPTRVRVPTSGTLRTVHEQLSEQTSGRLDGQGFLPPLFESMSVGDRSGVLSARRGFLVDSASAVPLDAQHPRFGRAGQRGPSVIRHIRTPRPGPLPPNTGSPEVDRRVRPSPLRHELNCRFVQGPLDVVRDDHALRDGQPAPWEVIVGMGGDRPGVMFERWDGSIDLVLEVRAVSPGTTFVKDFVWKHLFAPEAGPGTDAAAGVLIGARLLPYASLTFIGNPKFSPSATAFSHQTGRITLRLDRRAAGAVGLRGPIDREIADALATSGLVPPVTILLTVVPKESGVPPGENPTITLSGFSAALRSGPQRPPVSLRLPLSIVTTARGALPLVPATVLVTDPAYDQELGSPPHSSRFTIDESAGGRGQIVASFKTDRAAYDLKSSIAFMIDIAYERRLEPDPSFDGDLDIASIKNKSVPLSAAVIARATGERRVLSFARDVLFLGTVELARTYQFAIAALMETDGSAARLLPGDRLELSLSGSIEDIKLRSDAARIKLEAHKLRVVVTLTDRPVVEPPTALYSVMFLAGASSDRRLAVPLHAQSPVPERTAFGRLKDDFRRGYVRRTAAFPWMLSRTQHELDHDGRVFTVKVDRNGQMWLPSSPDKFAQLEQLALP